MRRREAAPPGPPLVVDTDVASFLFRLADTRGDRYRPHVAGQTLVISFMTVAELRLWPLRNNWGEDRRRELEAHMAQFTVIESDDELCLWWAQVRDRAYQLGRPIQASDAWIAATALRSGMPLVTHNPGDFAGVPGLTVITEQGS
jgi:tRNA(fMet)-specific endonuclease VapC